MRCDVIRSGFFPRAKSEACYCTNCTCPVVNKRCSTVPNYSGRYNMHCNCANQKCNVGYGCACANTTMNGVLNSACECTNCTNAVQCDGACDPSCCLTAINFCDTSLPGCELPPPPSPDDGDSDLRWYIIGGCFGGAFVILAIVVTVRTCRRTKPAGTMTMRELSRAASRKPSRQRSSRRPSTSTRASTTARKGDGRDKLLSTTSSRRGDDSAFSSVVTSPRHDAMLSPPGPEPDSALFDSVASGLAPATQLHDMRQPLVDDGHSLN